MSLIVTSNPLEQPDADHWLVADQARLKGVPQYLYANEAQPEYYSLYEGTALHHLSDDAPILIRAGKALYTEWKNNRNWSKNSSLWLSTEKKPEQLLNHLQSLLIVNDSQGIPCLFRFFVPATLIAWGSRIEANTPRLLGPFHALNWFSSSEWCCLQQTHTSEAPIIQHTRLNLTPADEKALEAK